MPEIYLQISVNNKRKIEFSEKKPWYLIFCGGKVEEWKYQNIQSNSTNRQ